LAGRLYGPPRPGALAEATRDLRSWLRQDRVAYLLAASLAVLITLLALAGAQTVGHAATATYTLLALFGLWLIVVQTGQPALGHAALMGIGAYVTAFLRLRAGLDGLTGAILAALFCGATGWVLGWGTSRLRPAFTSLATWSFGWLATLAVVAFPDLSGGTSGISLGAPMEMRIAALGIDARFNEAGHLLLAAALVGGAMLVLRSAQRSSIGRGWALLRENPSLARSLGYDVAAARRRAFFVGSALAGLAGALSAQAIGVVDPGNYSPLVSLQMFAAVLVGIPAGLLGPIVGLAVTGGIPAVLAPALGGTSDGRIQGVLVALLTMAALVVTVRWRGGLQAIAPQALAQGAGEGAGLEGAAFEGAAFEGPEPSAGQRLTPPGKAPALEVRRLNRAFGGVQALYDTSFTLAHGEIRGLIGPNGSGKSTFLRCISGALAADSGEILVDGAGIGNLDEAARVRAGVVRVFQRVSILAGLAATDQVALGLRRRAGNTNWVWSALKTPAYRAEERERRAAAARIMGLMGIKDAASAAPGTFATGRRRLLQVAVAAATGPSVLLLDEPTAGMDEPEAASLSGALKQLSAAGISIVVVEHNMRFLASVADRVTVLDAGSVIAEGSPGEVAASPLVRDAYLGRPPQPSANTLHTELLR
jgi:ABC-type branched-subunit amino acid transport system ATPase component/ABC-type branched-subunit amino acid transport system permease subunit